MPPHVSFRDCQGGHGLSSDFESAAATVFSFQPPKPLLFVSAAVYQSEETKAGR